jgi:hypothetical protein
MSSRRMNTSELTNLKEFLCLLDGASGLPPRHNLLMQIQVHDLLVHLHRRTPTSLPVSKLCLRVWAVSLNLVSLLITLLRGTPFIGSWWVGPSQNFVRKVASNQGLIKHN